MIAYNGKSRQYKLIIASSRYWHSFTIGWPDRKNSQGYNYFLVNMNDNIVELLTKIRRIHKTSDK